MQVAVASGKGGTGKTTVALALAKTATTPVDVIDCDVEEPNVHLFLPEVSTSSRPFTVLMPSVDQEVCTACGRCVRFCEYGALALAGSSVLVFEDLCHACGGCARICPVGAVTEVESRIGLLYQGGDETLGLSYGELAIGRTLAPPLIRAAKDAARSDVLRIVDAPPGTTCPMVAAIRDADFVVLVTENTPFGIHDLNLAAEVIRDLGIPCGAVINRSDIGSSADRSTAAYCRENGIEVLLEIPFDPAIAEAYATGGALIDAGGHYRRMFEDLNNLIRDRVRATT